MLSNPLCTGFHRLFPNQAKEFSFQLKETQSERTFMNLTEGNSLAISSKFCSIVRQAGDHGTVKSTTQISFYKTNCDAGKYRVITSEMFSFKFARSVASSSLFDIVTILFSFKML